jgi:hypothetical protein
VCFASKEHLEIREKLESQDLMVLQVGQESLVVMAHLVHRAHQDVARMESQANQENQAYQEQASQAHMDHQDPHAKASEVQLVTQVLKEMLDSVLLRNVQRARKVAPDPTVPPDHQAVTVQGVIQVYLDLQVV